MSSAASAPAPISSASTRLTMTTTVMSTFFLTQTVTIPNPTGTGLETVTSITPTETIAMPSATTSSLPASPMPSTAGHKAAIAGGVVGSLAAVGMIAAVAFMFLKRRRSTADQPAEKPYEPKKDIQRADRRSFHRF